MKLIQLCFLPITLILFTQSCKQSRSVKNIIIKIENNRFEKLNSHFEDKTIVGIGEFTHGDGNLFEVKAELIKHLHQDLGFEALLMESDFLAVDNILHSLGTYSVYEAVSLGVAPAWAQSKEYLELIDYLKETSEQQDTLHFHGFDPQLTGEKSLEIHLNFAEKIRGMITNQDFSHLKESIKLIENLNSMGMSADSLQILQTCLWKIMNDHAGTLDSRTSQWLKNLGAGMRTLYYRKLAPAVTPDNIPEVFSHPLNVRAKAVRDSMMADNIQYYLSKYDKVILWAANNHLRFKSNPGDNQMIWMGEILKRKFGDKFYSVLALYNEGTWSYPDGSRKGDIPKAEANTLADEISNLINTDVAFLPIESYSQEDKMIVRHNNWTITDSIYIKDYADAILYLDTVKGSTPVIKQ